MQKNQSTQSINDVLLLPGLMCNEIFWQPLMTSLPASRPTPRYQVVDYGDASSLTGMAAAVLAAAPPQFALAGHSMGGRVALEVMRLAGSRVQKLILMDTGYLPCPDGEAGATERAGRMALIDLASRAGVGAMCAQWVKGMVHPDRLNDEALINAIMLMFTRKTADGFARQQNALLTRANFSAVLAELTLPVLLMCGRHDSWANVAQHAAMQALAPHAQLSVIEDAGHMVLMEQPEATVQVIQTFLQSSLEL